MIDNIYINDFLEARVKALAKLKKIMNVSSISQVRDICLYYGVFLIEDEEFKEIEQWEVAYGSDWIAPNVIEYWCNDYEQSCRNVIPTILRKLEKRGYIRIIKTKWKEVCMSETCNHHTHDPDTFVKAKVLLKKWRECM